MCIRTITHWLPCCHQRCTSIELCLDAITTILTHSNPTTTMKEKTKSAEQTATQDKPETEAEKKKNLNPFDCPAGGPVFSDRASEEVCLVCGCEEARNGEGKVEFGAEIGEDVDVEAEDDVDADIGLGSDIRDAAAGGGDIDDESFDGYQEAEEAETLAALSWESYFDRYGWIG